MTDWLWEEASGRRFLQTDLETTSKGEQSEREN